MVRCLDKVTFSNRTDFIMKSRQDSGYERRINRAVGKTSSTLNKKVRYENKGRKQLEFSFSRSQTHGSKMDKTINAPLMISKNVNIILKTVYIFKKSSIKTII